MIDATPQPPQTTRGLYATELIHRGVRREYVGLVINEYLAKLGLPRLPRVEEGPNAPLRAEIRREAAAAEYFGRAEVRRTLGELRRNCPHYFDAKAVPPPAIPFMDPVGSTPNAATIARIADRIRAEAGQNKGAKLW